MKTRVFPAYIEDLDEKSVLFPHSRYYDKFTLVPFRLAPTFWSEKLPFDTVCGEFASPARG